MAFREGLKESGYIEGENVAIKYRWAEDQYDRLPELAAELVRRQVSVSSYGRRSAACGQGGDHDHPIVFSSGGDPSVGLVASLDRPSGNLTGIYLFARVGAKRLNFC